MLEMLKKMLKAKEEQRAALMKKAGESTEVAEVRSIHGQVETLANEITELRGAIEAAEGEAAKGINIPPEARSKEDKVPSVELNPLGTYGQGQEQRTADQSEQVDYEKRGKDLIEQRSVTVASSGILLAQHQASDIKGTFNQVSSVIDGVTKKPLIGGESYKRPYLKGYGTGGYTTESGVPTTAEPEFGYADINKAKVTAYAEDTEELAKLPTANYAKEVEKGIQIAIKKKVAAEILVGAGTTNSLMGIFNSTIINVSTDLKISEITNTTLDDIIFSYGGDEDVEDAAVLILSKKDLKAFALLRGLNGEKLHKIVTNGNAGTIDTIPYIINSTCHDVASATTGQYCMAYGPLSNYELAIFSDVDITKSTDYKFKEGMICHRGVTFVGGNVAAHNGFLRVKKA